MPVTIERQTEIGALAEEWDSLADRTGADPFRRPGWIKAWHEAFGRGTLCVLGARHEGRLIAVLPVEQTTGTLRSPTNWHSPLFGSISESTDGVDAIAGGLLADHPARISLSFVDSDDPLRDALLRQAEAARYRTLDATVQRSPYLELGGDWEAYWRGLASKRRNTLKRRRRRLEDRGEVTLSLVEGGERLGAALDEALRVEALGWKGERRSAIISRPQTHRFYRRVAAWAAPQGTLRLALLRVDERAVAFDYALETPSHHYLLKTGFDPDYRDCAPGVVLRTMMIERAYSLALERYEFLGGEDEYKLEWTDTSRDLRRVHAFSSSATGLANWAAFRYGRPAAKWVVARARR